jgi:hypothetical protein
VALSFPLRAGFCWCAIVTALVGCSSTSSGSGATTCDPLAARATKLGTVLGVGKDASGTIYVADQGGVPAEPSIVRVFIVQSGSLVRQEVTGSGQLGSGEYIETFESAAGSTGAEDLAVFVQGGLATSMTLGAAGSAKANAVGMDGGAPTPLTLVDPSAIESLPALDLPAVPSYVADGSDGNAIVVTVSLDDELGSAGMRLFYGAADAMVERPIVSFNQSGGGYPITIGFTVDGETDVMTVAAIPSTDGGPFPVAGPLTLTTAEGATVAYTLRDPRPTNLDGFSLSCLGM